VGALSSLDGPLEGHVVAPDAARHARYRAALARQRRLDDALDRVDER
jgi:hypothetical protein